MILLEHHWAVPLRDAMARAGGYRSGDGFISPLDLVEIGLVSSEEAPALDVQPLADPGRNPWLGDDRLAERGIGRRKHHRDDQRLLDP